MLTVCTTAVFRWHPRLIDISVPEQRLCETLAPSLAATSSRYAGTNETPLVMPLTQKQIMSTRFYCARLIRAAMLVTAYHATAVCDRFCSAQVEGASGELRNVLTLVDGADGRRFRVGSTLFTAFTTECENRSDAELLIQLVHSTFSRDDSFRTLPLITSGLLKPGVKTNLDFHFAHQARRTDWYVHFIFTGVVKKNVVEMVKAKPDWHTKELLMLDVRKEQVFFCRNMLYVRAGWDMPLTAGGGKNQAEKEKQPDDRPADSLDKLLLPAARTNLANVAMNNIGVDPWKRELDLSDAQFGQITKLSSQWNLDRGLSIVTQLQYIDDDKRTAELWRAYNEEQLAIAKKILVPSQMQRLVQLHNQNVLQADVHLNQLPHWIASPIFAEAVGLSKSQARQVEEITEELGGELKEIETNSTDRVNNAIERTDKQLRSILNEAQSKLLAEKLGDSIDAERWRPTLKIMREESQLSKQLSEMNDRRNPVRVLRGATEGQDTFELWSDSIDQEFLSFQLVFMLENKHVAEEIEVTDKQRAELEEITIEWSKQNKELAERRKGLDAADPLRAELGRLDSQIAAKMMEDKLAVYLPHQIQRLLQIRLQLMLAKAGYSPALAYPQWQDVMKLTTDQRREFNEILNDNDANRKRQDATALDKRRVAVMKAQGDLFKLLESGQRDRFEALFGDRVFLEWYSPVEE